jgi:hypothetical protein
MALPVVVLPHPDSPTSASVCRRPTLKDTPLTASKRRHPLQPSAAHREATLRSCHLEQGTLMAAGRRRRGNPQRCGAEAVRRSARVRPARRHRSQAAHRGSPAAPGRGLCSAGWAWAAARRKTAAGEVSRQRRHGAGNGRQRLAAALTRPATRAAARGHRDARAGEELAAGATSMIWPAYISATRWAMPATTARSWVISSSPVALLALQILEQVEDLLLDGDVQRGGGLVGNQEVGLGRQRHGDHHPLLLAAAHAEGVVVDAALGLGDAHTAQPVDGLGVAPPPRSGGVRSMASTICSPTFITGFRLVAGSWKIMPTRPPRTRACPIRAGPVLGGLVGAPSSVTRPPVDRAVVGQQAHQRQRRHALAAAGLAHQGKGLAALGWSGQAVDGAHDAGFGVQCHLRLSMAAWRNLRPWVRQACAEDQRGRIDTGARVEGIAHAVGKQVGRQHQRPP